MFLDKSLRIALLISTLFHTVVFLPLPHFKNISIKKVLPLRVTYVLTEEVSPKKTYVKKRSVAKITQQAKRKNVTAKFKANDRVKLENRPAEKIVSASKPENLHSKIEIPPELPKEKEASYLNYYQSIREKIRKLVVNNYPRFIACGEVCLYFVLSSNGGLKELNIVEERSSPNRLLKEIAKKSLYQATPFSPFPKDLNQRQLSFNVIISFELEN